MNEYTPEHGYFKWLSVKRVKELLAELDDDMLLHPNMTTKNVSVFKEDEKGEWTSVAQIDFLLEGYVEWFDGRDDNKEDPGV